MERLEMKIDDLVQEVHARMDRIDYDEHPEDEDLYYELEKARKHLEEAQWIFNCLKN